MARQIFRNINRAYYTSGSDFSNAFNPRDLTSCKLWLDAAQGITTVSGKVSVWADKSGRGNDVAQGTAGNRPVYSTNQINTLPTLTFLQANATSLSNTSKADLAPTNLHISVVSRFTAEFTNQFIVGRGDTAFEGYWIDYQTVGSNTFGCDLGNHTVAIRPLGSNRTISAYDVLSLSYDGANGTAFVNGTAGTPLAMTGSLSYVANDDFIVGNTTGLSATRYLSGDVAEITLFSSALTTMNRRRLEKYLGRKYGLTVV